MSATLQGKVRKKLGTRSSRILRLQGEIPVCIQGEGKPNVELSIEERAFLAARRQHEHLFDFEMDEGDAETALVRELQYDAFGERIIHVEFRRVVRGQKTEVEVALEFVGHPKGGILNHLMTHVSVMALPSEIPDSIEVKVDELEAGHPIFAKDLILPEGVTLNTDPDSQVAVIATAKAEVEETPAEGEEGAEGEAAEAPAEGAAPEPPAEG